VEYVLHLPVKENRHHVFHWISDWVTMRVCPHGQVLLHLPSGDEGGKSHDQEGYHMIKDGAGNDHHSN